MAIELERLVRDVLAGDESAWPRLWQAVEPRLYAILRRPHLLGRLSQSEDDCRNIVVEVMGRLRADGYARLGRFAEARRGRPDLPFMAWLVVVAQRVAIDYLRGHETYIDRRGDRDASTPGAWRELDTLPADSRLGDLRPAVTRRGTAHQILEYAEAELPADQVTALKHWLAGGKHDEIAAAMAIDARDAERLVRAALERIRRRFGKEVVS